MLEGKLDKYIDVKGMEHIVKKIFVSKSKPYLHKTAILQNIIFL